jgi:hypothetical protein
MRVAVGLSQGPGKKEEVLEEMLFFLDQDLNRLLTL